MGTKRTKARKVKAAVKSAPRNHEEIENWITNRFAKRLNMKQDEIDVRIPITSFGLDSMEAVGFVADLQTWLRRRLNPALLWESPNIAALAERLARDAD